MVSGQFHYTKRNVFMPFLLVEILNFQGSAHLRGVGSLSLLLYITITFCSSAPILYCNASRIFASMPDFFSGTVTMIAMIVPPQVLIKNGTTKVKSAAAVLPITNNATG